MCSVRITSKTSSQQCPVAVFITTSIFQNPLSFSRIYTSHLSMLKVL